MAFSISLPMWQSWFNFSVIFQSCPGHCLALFTVVLFTLESSCSHVLGLSKHEWKKASIMKNFSVNSCPHIFCLKSYDVICPGSYDDISSTSFVSSIACLASSQPSHRKTRLQLGILDQNWCWKPTCWLLCLFWTTFYCLFPQRIDRIEY